MALSKASQYPLYLFHKHSCPGASPQGCSISEPKMGFSRSEVAISYPAPLRSTAKIGQSLLEGMGTTIRGKFQTSGVGWE